MYDAHDVADSYGKTGSLPYAWRVTKYDPALRNSQGNYLGEDWTSFSDMGKFYVGRQLTYQDYLLHESAYVSSVMCFLSEAGLSSLRVAYLENRWVADVRTACLSDIVCQPSSLQLNSVVRGVELEDVIRLNLREVLWCIMVETSRFYLHFGWDFYMYVGSASPSLAAIRHTQQKGLFVEEMVSPYL